MSTRLAARLRVIVLAPRLDKQLHEYPFACVVSQKDSEKICDTTIPCLHVFCCEDNDPDFANGLYACRRETHFVGEPVDWPVLSTALLKGVKAYSKSLISKPDELPFQRVMLWQEYGHMHPPLAASAEGHALLAFVAALKWNTWLEQAKAADEEDKKFMRPGAARTTRRERSKKWGFDDALKDLCTASEWEELTKTSGQFDAGERLRKFCESVGLRRPERTDFETPYNQLLVVFKEALQAHEAIRCGWTKNGKS